MSRTVGVAAVLWLVPLAAPFASAQSPDVVDDVKIIRQTLEKGLDSLPEGGSMRWNNPRNGHYGLVKTGRASRSAEGQVCRAYERTWTFDGGTSSFEGLACMDQAGLWRVKNERNTGRVALAAPPSPPPPTDSPAPRPRETASRAAPRPPAAPRPAAAATRREPARQTTVATPPPAPSSAPGSAPAPAPAVVTASLQNAQPVVAPGRSDGPEVPLGRLPTRSVLR